MIREALMSGWENFVNRTTGPLSFRFIMQPLVASFFAVRAGINDSIARRPPYFWALLFHAGYRRPLVTEGLKRTGRIAVIAMIIDSIYQLYVQKRIYAGELVFTAATLAVVPYILIRGPTNRVVTAIARARRGNRSNGDGVTKGGGYGHAEQTL